MKMKFLNSLMFVLNVVVGIGLISSNTVPGVLFGGCAVFVGMLFLFAAIED